MNQSIQLKMKATRFKKEDFDPKLNWLSQDEEISTSSCKEYTEVSECEKALNFSSTEKVCDSFEQDNMISSLSKHNQSLHSESNL